MGAGERRARLHWADTLADDASALLGPGGRFELAEHQVGGFIREVFVGQPSNLRTVFDATAQRIPDAVLLVSESQELTFAQTQREVDAMAVLMRDRYGVAPGDRVAIVAANSVEYALAMWATLSIGAIVTSLNGWWTRPELDHGIELTSPSIVFGDAPRLDRLGPASTIGGVPVVELDVLRAEANGHHGEAPLPVADIAPDDPAVILFTSGTTGRAKGATLSHRNIIHFIWSGLASAATASATTSAVASRSPATHPRQPTAQPAQILCSPMFHVSGLVGVLMAGPAIGTKLVFPRPGRWDASEYLDLTVRHRVSSWGLVPTQYWRLIRHPELDSFDLSSVTSLRGGGAPFPPELGRALAQRFPWAALAQGYGMTETMGLGTRTGGAMLADNPEAVGVPNIGTEVEIRDEHDAVVPEGTVGEIHVRCASVFVGYWNDPKSTEAALDAEGWFRTGDFGRIEGGLLFLESRMRDLILRGGENIYPIEIEHRLVAHNDIDDAAVMGVDHSDFGQEVKAFVVARAGAAVSVADVRAWVGEALAPYKVPAHVEFRDALPYNESGKLNKRDLETETEAVVGRD